MSDQPCFFHPSDRYAALSLAGNPLESLAAVEGLEVFRGPLIAALGGATGAKAVDRRLIRFSCSMS